MLKDINKIIIHLSDLDEANLVLKKGLHVAQNHQASVEILYVHESPLFEVPDYFLSKKREGLDTEKVKDEIEAKVKELAPEIEVAIFVKIDDTADRIWALARNHTNTLVITAYHEKITQTIITKITQPVLVLKSETNTYEKLALLLNTNSNDIECVDDIKTHFNKSDIHLLYDYRYVIDPSMDVGLQNIQLIEQAERKSFEEIKEKSGLDGEFFVDGSFLGDDLVQYVQAKRVDIVVACANEEDFFVADTITSKLLEQVTCDILIDKEKL